MRDITHIKTLLEDSTVDNSYKRLITSQTDGSLNSIDTKRMQETMQLADVRSADNIEIS